MPILVTMNHRYGMGFLLVMAVVLFFTAHPVTYASEDLVHVVAKGETVYSISRIYRISQEELMKHNGISDATQLREGRRLRIPQAAGTNAPRTGSGTQPQPAQANETALVSHKVTKNDTLYSLARAYQTTVQRIKEINGLTSDVIKEGDNIRVPKLPAVAAAPPQGNTPAPPAAAKPGTGDGVRPTSAATIDTSVRWPVSPREIAYMTGKLYGVVVLGERTEAVKSLTQGTVISAGPYRGFGRVVMVEATGEYLYVYGGCESLSVKEGDKIVQGTELGKLGIDAVSGKPQLFFMVYRSGTPVDPAKAPRI